VPAYFESGFSVRKPSWHGQEMLLDDYPVDWADARVKAGLLWEPHLVIPQYEWPPDSGKIVSADNFRLVVRDDTGDVLGQRTDEFVLVSHADMGRILEEIIGGNIKFETAGSVQGGRMVWALVYLDEPYTVTGDEMDTHYPFIALLNGHAGTAAVKLTLTQVRVVCWNTWQQAFAEGARHGREFTFRHVGDPMERIEAAKAAIQGVRDEAKEYVEMAAGLLGMTVTDVQVRKFLSEFIPEPPADVVSDRVRENIAEARRRFDFIYSESPTTEKIRGTGYGLLMAATEYLDHVRDYNSRDTYLGRTLLRREPMKARALATIRRVVK